MGDMTIAQIWGSNIWIHSLARLCRSVSASVRPWTSGDHHGDCGMFGKLSIKCARQSTRIEQVNKCLINMSIFIRGPLISLDGVASSFLQRILLNTLLINYDHRPASMRCSTSLRLPSISWSSRHEDQLQQKAQTTHLPSSSHDLLWDMIPLQPLSTHIPTRSYHILWYH